MRISIHPFTRWNWPLLTPEDWKLVSSPHFPCRQASQGNKLEPVSFWEAKFHDKGRSEVTAYVCGAGTAVGQLHLSPYDTQPQASAELSVARAFLLLCKQCQITMVCPSFLCCFLLSYLISFYKFRPLTSLAPNLALPVIGLWHHLALGYPYLPDVPSCVLTPLV